MSSLKSSLLSNVVILETSRRQKLFVADATSTTTRGIGTFLNLPCASMNSIRRRFRRSLTSSSTGESILPTGLVLISL
jgi:hypothetical protein